MSDVFYDRKGNEISEFDVVKVFHFTGARRKQHYMYKWIRKNKSGQLCIMHLSPDSENLVPLNVVSKRTVAAWIFTEAEIVQTFSDKAKL